MSNPFEIKIPLQHQMMVDCRVWEAKLDDSYNLGRIIKWLLDNRPESEDMFDAFSDDAGSAIIRILSELVEYEKAIRQLRRALGQADE